MAKVIILSGAGISAESGISTFRDSYGLWEKYKIKDICTVGCLNTNRKATIEFYDYRRSELKDKKPNYAHKVISQLKSKYPNDIAVITQNVDDMFPYRLRIEKRDNLKEDSDILINQIRTLSKTRIKEKIAKLSNEEYDLVIQALCKNFH